MKARTTSNIEATSEAVFRFIERRALIPSGSAVLVACSGGADSTALLDLLDRLAARGGWRLGVVHLDHGQHPGSARIARRVRAVCRRRRIPVFTRTLGPIRLPVGSSEALMRSARYEIFTALAEREGFDRIATGHTASDQAETVLMRLLRGSGPGGLAGIPAGRDGKFIRPLLELERGQIVAYLESRRLRWQEDPTNQDLGLLRNRVRHEVLPLLRRAVNPAVDRALLRLSKAAARDERTLESLAAQIPLEPSALGGVQARLKRLVELPAAVQARVLMRMVAALAGPGTRLEQIHLERLLTAVASGGGFRIGLQAGLEAIGRAGRLQLGWAGPPEGFAIDVTGPGQVRPPGPTGRIDIRLDHPYCAQAASAGTAFFDAASMPFPLQIRSPRPGDWMRPWGGGGRRKVARILSDAKIPAGLRPLVALLVCGQRVMWIAGIRRSDLAPVVDTTRAVLSMVCLDGPRWGP